MLKPTQIRAAALLVMGKKACDVAKEVGVTPETISAWRRNPEFVAVINAAKMEVLNSARDALRHSARKAVTTLVALLDEPVQDSIRRQAALDILDMVGIANPEKRLYGWGVGPTNPKDVEREQANQEWLAGMADNRLHESTTKSP